MVKVKGASDYERMDSLMREACEKSQLKLDVTGWTRKTYNVYIEDRKARSSELIARVESFATTNGEIRVYDDRAMEFAQELGESLEKEFGLKESVIIREDRPK